MKTLTTILSVAALLVTLALVAPAPADASVWCNQCAATGDCFACCKCDGYTTFQCANWCEGTSALPASATSCDTPSPFDSPWNALASDEAAPQVEEAKAATKDDEEPEQPQPTAKVA